MRRLLAILLVALWPAAASAALTQSQLDAVALAPPKNARAPLDLTFRGLDGRETTLADAISGRPTLLMPVDYTCKQTCGPALSIAASALSRTGLQAGTDYSLVVVGIDARDGIEAARRFTEGQVGGPGVSVLTGDASAIRTLTNAIGYSFASDEQNDAIAHPTGFVTLAADGHVSRALSSLALTPTDLRLSLIEAGQGKIGGLTGRLALLCYGFDAVHGIYTRQITTLLRLAGGVTVVAIAGAIALLSWRSSRRGARA